MNREMDSLKRKIPSSIGAEDVWCDNIPQNSTAAARLAVGLVAGWTSMRWAPVPSAWIIVALTLVIGWLSRAWANQSSRGVLPRGCEPGLGCILVCLCGAVETATAAPVATMESMAVPHEFQSSSGGFENVLLQKHAVSPSGGGWPRRLLNTTTATAVTSSSDDTGIIVGGLVIGLTVLGCIATLYMYSNEWEERYEGRMRRLKAQEEAAKTLKAKDQETAKVEQDPDAPSMAIVPAS